MVCIGKMFLDSKLSGLTVPGLFTKQGGYERHFCLPFFFWDAAIFSPTKNLDRRLAHTKVLEVGPHT